MGSDNRGENEEFNLEIDSAVETFFSHYEENAPQMDDPSDESEPDIISEEEKAALGEEMEVPDHDTEDGADDSMDETQLFNSLTEAILTIDWEVNDVNVKNARESLEKIQATFPALKESRAQKVIDGMLATLDCIAASPQSVPTSATAQLEKALPILRGIATGAQMEDGYDELVEDVIAGLEACQTGDELAVEGEEAESSSLMTSVEADEISDDDGESLEAEWSGPTSVPADISNALRHHTEVVAQLTIRARKLAKLYKTAKGTEKVYTLLQKICGVLELQTRALQDAFSLNLAIAIFPLGKIENLSDFLSFQLKAMGVCLKHVRVLENAFKKQPRRKRLWQSIYLLRISMQRQIDVLSEVAVLDKTPDKTASPPLSDIVQEHLHAMEEIMEHAASLVEYETGGDLDKINEAGRVLRDKIARQIDILRRAGLSQGGKPVINIDL